MAEQTKISNAMAAVAANTAVLGALRALLPLTESHPEEQLGTTQVLGQPVR